MNHVVLSSVLLSVAVIPAYSIDKFVKTHQELLRLYPCRDPQERVFDVEDIVPLEEYKKIPVKKITPHSVALHTCHATGYCNDANEKCMPHKVTNVTIEFGDYTHNSATPIPWIVANHTECVCVKMDLSKSKP